MLITGIELTRKQHQFQVVDELWEGVIYITQLRVAEGPADLGTVGQKMQPVTFLYQAGTQLRNDVTFESPGRGND
ncbi:hypothetical protein BHU62_14420 [Serratia marcescens]|uniref:Uncharacterized protein n=1 Tax=Serratia marcescens TaxID=615 RepID=A0A1Q4NZ17_SERMA|nr:hypothetical protein BHU62_14420 [Serratia marcescens]